MITNIKVALEKNDLDALAKYVEEEVLITLKQDGDDWSAKWKYHAHGLHLAVG
jgi:hypothetical protein